jgi:hypothetical protein
METRLAEKVRVRTARVVLPELTPWREVGWIFRDGESIVVERQGEETRERKVS